MEDEWKKAAIADAQKVCDLSTLTTELADALESVLFSAVGQIQGFSKSELYEQAKAALAKMGR